MRRGGALDPVSPELRDYVFRRDPECVVAILIRRRILPRDTFGRCDGPDTAAHVRDSRGGRTGKRPPSTPRRLVRACRAHHVDYPTVDLADVRPLVDAYLEEKEGPDVDDSRPWETIRRVRASGEASRVPSTLTGVGPGTIPASGRRSDQEGSR